jgi:hypothetical protein
MTKDKGQRTNDSPCQLALIAPTYLKLVENLFEAVPRLLAVGFYVISQ